MQCRSGKENLAGAGGFAPGPYPQERVGLPGRGYRPTRRLWKPHPEGWMIVPWRSA
jgi:hypothetical protein